jgi:hypothetical protein
MFLCRGGDPRSAFPAAEALRIADGCGVVWHAERARVKWRRGGGRSGTTPPGPLPPQEAAWPALPRSVKPASESPPSCTCRSAPWKPTSPTSTKGTHKYADSRRQRCGQQPALDAGGHPGHSLPPHLRDRPRQTACARRSPRSAWRRRPPQRAGLPSNKAGRRAVIKSSSHHWQSRLWRSRHAAGPVYLRSAALAGMPASAYRTRSTRVFLPASYATRAPRLWMFPSGTRKVSQVPVPSDSGPPGSSVPPRANSALA